MPAGKKVAPEQGQVGQGEAGQRQPSRRPGAERPIVGGGALASLQSARAGRPRGQRRRLTGVALAGILMGILGGFTGTRRQEKERSIARVTCAPSAA
jgi:hypothetical protein